MLCDVVEMDACHIHLGTPWLFDRQVYYDGKENTYEFRKDGQWYKLTPMKENAVNATKICGDISMSNKNILLCSTKDFLKEERREEFYLVVVPKAVKEEMKTEKTCPQKLNPC